MVWEINNDKHSDHKEIFNPATNMFNEILHVSKLIINIFFVVLHHYKKKCD